MEIKIKRDGNLKEAIKDLETVNKKTLRVGIFPESGDLEMIARVHEFGATIRVTPKMRAFLHHKGLHLKATTNTIVIPERSFIRAGFRENEKKFVKHSKDMLIKAIKEGVNPELVFDRLGNELVGDIQDYAVELRNPENHPFTVKQKGSDNPLVDTGRMIGEITHKVEG